VGKSANLDKVMSDYYGEDQVVAIITIKANTKEAEKIAMAVSKFELIEDVFLVTGDTDIIAKARFENYAGLKDFVLKSLAPINGIKDTKTLMVVTAYKERGVTKVIE